MIATSYFWSNIIALAVCTLAIRFSIVAISGRVVITERTKEIFSFIPAAILPGLAGPMVFFHKGSVDWVLGKERFLILMLSTVVCYFSKSTLATIVFGLVALYFIGVVQP